MISSAAFTHYALQSFTIRGAANSKPCSDAAGDAFNGTAVEGALDGCRGSDPLQIVEIVEALLCSLGK